MNGKYFDIFFRPVPSVQSVKQQAVATRLWTKQGHHEEANAHNIQHCTKDNMNNVVCQHMSPIQ